MADPSLASAQDVGTVTVRYWGAARAAAGLESEPVPLAGGTTLAEVLDAVRARHRDRPRLAEVLSVCSVLVGDRPVGSREPADVPLVAGDVVELLPPFAGGSGRESARRPRRCCWP